LISLAYHINVWRIFIGYLTPDRYQCHAYIAIKISTCPVGES